MDSIEQRTQTLISQMTLDEKLAQIGSFWMWDLQTNGQLDDAVLEVKLKEGIGQITALLVHRPLIRSARRRQPITCKISLWREPDWESLRSSMKSVVPAP